MIKRIIKRRDNELKIFAFPFYIVFLSFISDIFIIIGIFLCFHSFILSFYYLISNNFYINYINIYFIHKYKYFHYN